MKLVTAILLTISWIVVCVVIIIKSIQFDQNCGGNLKRAADANTVEMAKRELYTALDYIERNNLMTGYTSAIYKTPDEDLGFWYNNIKTAYQELDSLPVNSEPLQKSNMLMKLRETLIDHGDSGDEITVPNGVSRYPNNLAYGVIFLFSFLACLIAWFFVVIDDF